MKKIILIPTFLLTLTTQTAPSLGLNYPITAYTVANYIFTPAACYFSSQKNTVILDAANQCWSNPERFRNNYSQEIKDYARIFFMNYGLQKLFECAARSVRSSMDPETYILHNQRVNNIMLGINFYKGLSYFNIAPKITWEPSIRLTGSMPPGVQISGIIPQVHATENQRRAAINLATGLLDSPNFPSSRAITRSI